MMCGWEIFAETRTLDNIPSTNQTKNSFGNGGESTHCDHLLRSLSVRYITKVLIAEFVGFVETMFMNHHEGKTNLVVCPTETALSATLQVPKCCKQIAVIILAPPD